MPLEVYLFLLIWSRYFKGIKGLHSLLNAVSEDNLVVMRELGVPGMLRDQIQESVKKVRSIPLRTTEIPKKQAVKTDEDWHIQGQLSIYDLEVS